MAQLKNVVFDVGRVLVDYSYADFFRLLNSHGADVSDEDDFTRRVGLADYEHGSISDQEYFARVCALLDREIDRQVLEETWRNLMFRPLAEMLTFAGQLKQHCGVYLLSNTSAMHWDYLKMTFQLADICHGLFASFEVGCMKPDAAIYREAEKRFSLVPETTLFVDDKQANVAGAMACGWQGLWHQDSAATCSTIRNLLAAGA